MPPGQHDDLGARQVGETFAYTSASNRQWLSPAGLKRMLDEAGDG